MKISVKFKKGFKKIKLDLLQGVYRPGKPGKVREIHQTPGKPGKVREI